MRPFERLCNRLRDENHIDVNADTFERTRAGHWQRSAGAWSWWAKTGSGRCEIGSQYPVKELLKAKKLQVSNPFVCQYEVDPA